MTVCNGVSLRARPASEFASVCACMSVLTHALGPADFIGAGGRENTTVFLPLLFLAMKPQSPASWCHQGQRARQAELRGKGGEGPPWLPLTPILE